MDAEPITPNWGKGCVADLIPAILEPDEDDSLLPAEVVDASCVVVLVFDGLGWAQLKDRAHLAPTLCSLVGGPITTVVPSTTAAALTSITTGTGPGEHGIVGYRIDVDGEVLNMLAWRTSRGDARERIVPEKFQSLPPFFGQRPVVVQNGIFMRSPFTRAHLADTRQHGYWTLPTLPVQIRQAVAAGEPFVYAYYDGIDKIAHAHGFGEHYDAELAACDHVVADLMMMLPRGTALVVTADHGLVDCRSGRTALDKSLLPMIDRQSGEARFRWLHAEAGRGKDLLAAAVENHDDRAWVRPVDQILDEGWFGPIVTDTARSRLGDVALVARDHWWFVDPAEANRIELVGRHGSLTPEEMFVPLITFHS